MSKWIRKTSLLAVKMIFICQSFSSAYAALYDNLQVIVNVISTPDCTINGGNTIVVNFGPNVMTTRVDGTNYLQNIEYTLTCTNYFTNAMRMQISGTASSFNSQALNTDKTNLAIAIKNNGGAYSVNNWINFDYPNKPALSAVPIKRPGYDLTGGTFNATATMTIEYR